MAPWRGEELEGDRVLEEEPGTPQGPTATLYQSPKPPPVPGSLCISFCAREKLAFFPTYCSVSSHRPSIPPLSPKCSSVPPCLEGSSCPFSQTVKMCPPGLSLSAFPTPHHSSLGERRRQAWGLLLES